MASSTQKKTTTKKSGSRSGSRTAKGKQPQKRPIRREVGGVILLVLALCVLVSYCGVQAILIDLLAIPKPSASPSSARPSASSASPA